MEKFLVVSSRPSLQDDNSKQPPPGRGTPHTPSPVSRQHIRRRPGHHHQQWYHCSFHCHSLINTTIMAMERRLCVCLVLLAAAHASQPQALPFPAHGLSRPPRPSSGVSYPYVCPSEETLTKVKTGAGRRSS